MRIPEALAVLLALPHSAGILACGAARADGTSQALVVTTRDVPAALTSYPSAPFEDSRGNFWFSTVGAGLVRFDGKAFVTYTKAEGLAADIVRGKMEDKEGRLWFATTDGVSLYDGKTFTTLTDYGDTPVTTSYNDGGDHRDVWDVLQDRNGIVWITTIAGVFRYDGARFAPFALPVIGSATASEFHPKFVYDLFEAKDGTLWFGTDGAGAVSYDGQSMKVYTAKDHGLCSDRVCEVLQDGRGDLWFGTSDGGVTRYDGESFTTHLRSQTHSIHTGWGRYMSFLEDRDGNVWIGAAMEGGGVHRWDGEAFRYFSEKEGLNTSGIPSLSHDRSGRLWAGTTTGVFRLEGERFVPLTSACLAAR